MSAFKIMLLALGCFAAGIIVANLISPTPPDLTNTDNQTAVFAEQQECVTKPAENTVVASVQSSTDKARTSISDRDTKMLIARLQKQVAQLESALAYSEQSLEVATQPHDNTDDSSNSTTAQSKNNRSTSSEQQAVSKEQAESLLPEPFSAIMTDMQGKTAESFNKFKEESEDYDWSLTMENNIKDYISMHELATHIEINSVICKTNICEIRVFERKEESWTKLLKQMSDQTWWTFVNTASSGSSSEEFGSFAYVLASKLP